jgi:NitT/TauT family transport system substrate-binding protein
MPKIEPKTMKLLFQKSNLTRLLAGAVLASAMTAAQAEGQISIAQQFGIGYLILDVVQDQKLIEKHGKAQGLSTSRSNGARYRAPPP